MNLVEGNEMIIFESILTTFIARFIFEAVKTLSNIGSSLKLNHHRQI